MGLIKCVDCGHMVSDRAKACPQCGCPIEIIKNEYNTVIHPQFGRGKIVEEDKTYISILFENTGVKKRFLKTVVMPMLKFLNEDYKQNYMDKEQKETERLANEREDAEIEEFWENVNAGNTCKWSHADYVKIFWKYHGKYEKKSIINNRIKYAYEDTPVGAILLWIEQMNHDETVVIPEKINNSIITFIADSFCLDSFIYPVEMGKYDDGFENRIHVPKTIRYIENIQKFFEMGINILSDDDAFISFDISHEKANFLSEMFLADY